MEKTAKEQGSNLPGLTFGFYCVSARNLMERDYGPRPILEGRTQRRDDHLNPKRYTNVHLGFEKG